MAFYRRRGAGQPRDERLYGQRVVTFCIMGNHFHILVEVPRLPETLPPDEALVSATKGKDEALWLNYWLTHWREEGNHAAAKRSASVGSG